MCWHGRALMPASRKDALMSDPAPLDTLIPAWLAARSVARGLPLPVADRGGFRVDSGLDTEIRRWVFPHICDGLKELGREINAPFLPLKLCGDGAALMACLPDRWQLEPPTWFMHGAGVMTAPALPSGYRAETMRQGATVYVQINTTSGDVAASGYAAYYGATNQGAKNQAPVFVYDRIITAPAHQRKGLGTVVMARLKAEKAEADWTELLVATSEGRALYERLGWTLLSPYSTALIPVEVVAEREAGTEAGARICPPHNKRDSV